MRLSKIKIKSFKGIKEVEFPLNALTVLVGTNNAGKSSALQAIHLAARVMAQAKDANKQSTLSMSELEYLPTSFYKQLAHNSNWGNNWSAPQSEVHFTFTDTAGNPVEGAVILKSARNEGLSVDPKIPPPLIPIFRGKDRVFSTYIPGLAGIPLEETRITKRHLFRKAASGDSNVVLRNILLLAEQQKRLTELQSLLRLVYPLINLRVSFDEQSDYFIRATFSVPGRDERPLEFAGTGLLQTIQILAYLVVFRPTVLMIEEPESHLHPTLQTRLARVLQERVKDFGCSVIITTHSPFVVRALPAGSNVVWLKDGKVSNAGDSDLVRQALGWGALDKPILLVTEDKNTSLLEKILLQRPDLENIVSIFPFSGSSRVPSKSVLLDIRSKLGGYHKIIVHRDRDCMSDAEVADWKAAYSVPGIVPWVTEFSDVEAYFCQFEHIADTYGILEADAADIVVSAISSELPQFLRKFRDKRKEANRKYDTTGGSPSTEILLRDLHPLQWCLGKDLLSAIRTIIQSRGLDEKKLAYPVPECEIGEDLLDVVQTLSP